MLTDRIIGRVGADILAKRLADPAQAGDSVALFRLDKLSLQFAMSETGLIGEVLEAYERLILDAMRGSSLRASATSVSAPMHRTWSWSAPSRRDSSNQ